MKARQFLLYALPVLFAVFALAAITAIRAQGQASSPMLLEVDAAPLQLLRGGALVAEFDVEIAASGEERARGLMFRTEFPPDRAMLFVFDREEPVNFWMRNTPRPLDILFVAADGEIRAIALDTEPFSEAAIPSGVPARYALEVNAGIVNYLRIEPGDRLAHPAIGGR